MSRGSHEQTIKESFGHQVPAFTGDNSVYAIGSGPLGWAGPLTAEMIALDAACGAAHAAESVAPHVRQVVGLDLTDALLTVGVERLRTAGIGNVLLQQGNVEQLPFTDGSFDLTFCRSSLHHFEAPDRAIAEMVRVTRPGGRLVLLDLVAPADADREFFDELHRHLDPSHVRTYTEEELAAALPPGVTILARDSADMRFPLEVAIADNSDAPPVLAALRAELAGGRPTGLAPIEADGTLTVSFLISTVHAVVPHGESSRHNSVAVEPADP